MTPFLNIDDKLFYYLKELSKPTYFICSNYEDKDIKTVTSMLDNVTIFHMKHLPTQIILTDQVAIFSNISLQNFHKDNFAVGFAIYRNENAADYLSVVQIFEHTIRESDCIIDNGSVFGYGHCLRCSHEISLVELKGLRAYDYQPHHLLCKNCYHVWRYYRNYEYKERYCYICGKQHQTSVAFPMCRLCYRQINYGF